MAEKSGLEAKLLGPLVLCRDGVSVEENSARQPRPWLLLKYLLVNPGRQVGLEELRNRLSNITTRGIAFGPGENLDTLYAKRVPVYASWADLTIPADPEHNNIEHIVDQIVAQL